MSLHPSVMKFSLLCVVLFTSISGNSETPGELLIYYGFPSLINGSQTIPEAASHFGQYDIVVLGDCLQEDGSVSTPIGCDPRDIPHPDRPNVISIMNDAATQNTMFFGYVDLGVTGLVSQNLGLVEIQRRAELWKDLGVQGILLDEFGYDFGVSRERQNAAVDLIHDLMLSVIANGFFVDDVFSPQVHSTYNLSGASTTLDGRDYYLYESHQFRNNGFSIPSNFVPESEWQAKANRLEFFRQQLGFSVLSITTSANQGDFTPARFAYSWHSAAMYEHAATGWGEPVFSASDNSAPLRARPNSLIERFITPIPTMPSDSIYIRTACNGTLIITSATGLQSSDFVSEEFCPIFENGFEGN